MQRTRLSRDQWDFVWGIGESPETLARWAVEMKEDLGEVEANKIIHPRATPAPIEGHKQEAKNVLLDLEGNFYFLTLTHKWPTEEDVVARHKRTIDMILRSATNGVLHHTGRFELTDAGCPHVHILFHVPKNKHMRALHIEQQHKNFIQLRKCHSMLDVVNRFAYIHKGNMEEIGNQSYWINLINGTSQAPVTLA